MENLIYRVDGSKSIGLGHISRALALAGELKKFSEITFVMRDFPEGTERVRAQGYRIVPIPRDAPPIEEIGILTETISERRAKGLIIDKKDNDYVYMSLVKRSGVIIWDFDDLGSGRSLADYVIDANLSPEENIADSGNTRYMLGPKYMVLNGSFTQYARKRKSIGEVKQIMITMGGSDPQNLTSRVIRALDEVRGDIKTIVVTGGAFAHYDALQDTLNNIRGDLILRFDIPNMAELMYQSDIAITSGGITMFEAASLGTPAIILCQNEDQMKNARRFSEAGAAVNLGLGSGIPEEAILIATISLMQNVEQRRSMSEAGKRLVDGRGRERVVEAIRGEI
ncbi:MAG: UDP-2,4-diacetamido-2,4,6-trideoxy-beta-L-altropyranose hydrolase [bacterium]